MFGRITSRSNQISTENCVDPADHLKMILTMATVPLPTRGPNEAERVDGEERCADYNQSNLEEFFACDVVHLNLRKLGQAKLVRAMCAAQIPRGLCPRWVTTRIDVRRAYVSSGQLRT
jgi:hypothetical protein